MDDRGNTLISVVLVGFILTAALVLSMNNSLQQVAEADRAVRSTSSLGAAEGAIDDYIAKLAEDRFYFLHHVHPAESTRRSASGVERSAGEAWTGDPAWTYPYGKDHYENQTDGRFAYNLQVLPPSPGTQTVRIVATGRSNGTSPDARAVEVHVRPASIADFQMIANENIGYGSTATTFGKLYAGINASGQRKNIAHSGNAHGDLYAEGNISPQPTYHDGAQGYDEDTIRTVIKNPINFNTFTGSLVEIQSAATSGGLLLDNASVHGWRLVFRNDGTVRVAACTRTSGRHLADAAPTCGSETTHPVPTNGAIYSPQSIIVGSTSSGSVVNGRVTAASNADVIVGHNISYLVGGDDVLGLIARQDFIIARWTPNVLTWRAATLAQQDRWHSWCPSPSGYSPSCGNGIKSTMTFEGSTATNLGGFMSMFSNRTYLYDTTLLYLSPPYFPVLEDAYTTVLFREVGP